LTEELSFFEVSLGNLPNARVIIVLGATPIGLPIFDLSKVGGRIRKIQLSIVTVEALVLWVAKLKLGQILLPSQVGRLQLHRSDLLHKIFPDQFGGLVGDLLAINLQVSNQLCQIFGAGELDRWCAGTNWFFDWLDDWGDDYRWLFDRCSAILL